MKQVHRLIRSRFSPRKFVNEEIKDEEVESIFEAARLAPSSFNRQPWFYYWAKKGTEGFEKLGSFLTERNKWAKEASMLVLACYEAEDERGKNSKAEHDLGLANMSLVIQAQALGYYCHMMGGFDGGKAKKGMKMFKLRQPGVMIAIGKLGDEKIGKRDRKIKIADKV